MVFCVVPELLLLEFVEDLLSLIESFSKLGMSLFEFDIVVCS